MDEDKTQIIKAAALNIFTKKGYKETKMTDIAVESGISIGTIYSYYKSKKELFDSLKQPDLETLRPLYEAKRTEIILKALTVFGQNGYSATSMDKIATECGFTKAALYQYFKSKEELFSAIFNAPAMFINLENLQIEPLKFDFDEVLYSLGSIFMEVFEDPNRLNLIRIVVAESVRFPELGKIVYTEAINAIAEVFSIYLDKLLENGKIQCSSTKLAARSYFGMLHSFIMADKIINPANKEFSTDDIIKFAAKVFQRGLLV